MNIKLKSGLFGLLAVCLVGCNNQVAESGKSENSQVVEQIEGNSSSAVEKLMSEPEASQTAVNQTVGNSGVVRKLTTKEFVAEIYDYKSNPGTWVYKGTKPAIIDFYADWCGPCKRVAPIMDKLAKQYDGKVEIYKINTDEEGELSGGVFGIKSIPSILFIPAKGQPMMYTGAYPEEEYIKLINDNLLSTK